MSKLGKTFGILAGPAGWAGLAIKGSQGRATNRIYGAPSRFAATGNTLSLGQGMDPGQMTLPSLPGNLSVAGYSDPGSYVGAGQSADYTNALFQGLGISPAETSAAIKAAGTAALNQGAHATAVSDAARMSQMGQTDSGTAAALASRRGIGYAAADADLQMKAAMDEAARRQAYDQMALGTATGYGQAASQYNLGAADARNQFELGRAGLIGDYNLGLGGLALEGAGLLGDYNLSRAGMLSDDQFRRSMAEHEANVMFPMSLQAGDNAARQSMWGNLAGGLLSAGGSAAAAACWVAELLWGANDRRTHNARLYASTVDTPFTIAYRKHGREWAERLSRDPEMLMSLAPIWEEMAREGENLAERMAA